MSADKQKIALYSQGAFGVANPSTAEQATLRTAASQLAQSGFGTFLFGQWHAHAGATNEDFQIFWNDTAYTKEAFDWSFSTIPGLLKAGGGVQYVLLTFGPFPTDYDAIRNNVDAFKALLLQIFTDYAIDGIDFDPEPHNGVSPYTPENLQLLADLTEWVVAQGKIVTAAPYMQLDWWQQLLQKTTRFSWWNLQLYGGADYASWVAGLAGYVSDPQSFLTCGYNAGGTSASDVTSALQDLEPQYAGLNGAFIWNYEAIEHNPASYAQAIEQGLA